MSNVSKYQYFKKNNDKMVLNRQNPRDNGETVGLLVAEPIPVSYNSLPQSIQDNRNLIIDEEPTRFYHCLKIKFYLFIGFISFLIIFIIIFISNIKFVTNSVDVKINEFTIVDVNENGINLDVNSINVSFNNLGLFNWVEKFNETNIQFTDNIKIYDNNKRQIIEIETEKFNDLRFIIIDNAWRFNLSNLETQVDGEKLGKLIKSKVKTKFNVKFSLLFHGLIIPIDKTILINENRYDGIIDKLVSATLNDAKIDELKIEKYDENLGLLGYSSISFNSNAVDFIPNFNLTTGFYINNTFIEFGRLNIQKSNISRTIEVNFVIDNIDKQIINEGIIDELLWRFLNNDIDCEKFRISMKGNNNFNRGNLSWIENLLKILDIDISFHINDIKKLFSKTNILENTETLINFHELKVDVNETTGLIELGALVSSDIDVIFPKFSISTYGEISFKGIDLIVSNITIIKEENRFINLKLENIEFDIIDYEKSKEFIQYLINGVNEEYLETKIELFNIINSSFFSGLLKIETSILVNIDEIISIINSKIFDEENGKKNFKKIELISVEYLSSDVDLIKFKVQAKMKIPNILSKFENGINFLNVELNYNKLKLFDIELIRSSSFDGYIPLEFNIGIDSRTIEKKTKIEEFIGGFISNKAFNITISGNNNNDKDSLSGCNKNTCEIFENIQIPLNITLDNIKGDNNNNNGDEDENKGKNYFIRDTTMHIISREVEMILFNPIINSAIILEIEEGEAISEGYVIGYLKEKTIWEVKSGIWNSPKAKVEYANTGSAGWKLLEKAFKGDGILNNMTIRAVIKVYIKEGTTWKGFRIMYESNGQMNGKVRWI
jgi:hypothetical protein